MAMMTSLMRSTRRWALLSAILWLILFSGVIYSQGFPAYEYPDPYSGRVINGGFETGDFTGWVTGGTLPSNVTDAYHYSGRYSAQLGIPVLCIEQPSGSAWMRQTITIPADMSSPLLSFQYRIITNDILGWSSFHVEIRDGDNNTLVEVLQDGYDPPDGVNICDNDLDWRYYEYDLSPFKGQEVNLWFENKNEWDGALGIWTYVDDVKVFGGEAIHCDELVVNGSFEEDGAWVIDDTPHPARYSTDEAHSGGRSMLLGIKPPEADAYSWSSVRQEIAIPADVTKATLSFWYKPFTEDTVWSDWRQFDWDGYSLDHRRSVRSGVKQSGWDLCDWQEALILDDNSVIAVVMRINSDSRVWTKRSFDLMPYAGRTINVYFNAFNDGWGGQRTWMYLDDVSVEVCYGSMPPPPLTWTPTPTPTWTPTHTPTPTSTPTITPTPTPTLSPNPVPQGELIVNGGFETEGGWVISNSPCSARYSTDKAHSGQRSMFIGIKPSGEGSSCYSFVRQEVAIPANATSVVLSFWYYPISGRNAGSDWQGASVLDMGGPRHVIPVMKLCSDARAWTFKTFDLTRCAGRSIVIDFSVFNDGVGDVPTSMYLDDVSIIVRTK